MVSPFFTVITSYHFGPTSPEEIERFLSSLVITIRQMGDRARLVLVASGTGYNTLHPEMLVQLLNFPLAQIETVSITDNLGNIESINQGVRAALALPEIDNEWICSVESSVTLDSEWLDDIAMTINSNASVSGIYGKLHYLEELHRIWTYGHRMVRATLCNNFFDETDAGQAPNNATSFPCFSAACYKREHVKKVVEKYGEFVSPVLERYGNCTDAALRLRSVSSEAFAFCESALAYKRQPTYDIRSILTARLFAAYYYSLQNYDQVVKYCSGTAIGRDAIAHFDQDRKEGYSSRGTAPPTPWW